MSRAVRGAATLLTLLGLSTPPLLAQGKTDVVTLANGDRITGEVDRLERGRLKFETDDAGTLYLEWDNITSVIATRLVEVTTSDGRTYLGSLQKAMDRYIAVAGGGDTVPLAMQEVTLISQIGRSFWKKLDGSIDIGYSYTKSSDVSQLNVNTETEYRGPRFLGRLTFSLTQTATGDEDEADDRGALEASYVKYFGRRGFVLALGRLESNESLGLELRSQAAGGLGVRVVNSNRAQVAVGGGIAVNQEQGVDVESTGNVEALALYRASYFTYDRPRTNLDLTAQYYAGVTDFGRHRLQLDASARREFWKDVFVSASLYNTFDSRPPNPDADSNDVGIVLSVGWSY
jgi:hypothetical protein